MILLSCIVFTISYCAVLGEEIIKWSAIGSTNILECSFSQNNIKTIFKPTRCFWETFKCRNLDCVHQHLKEDDRIKVNGYMYNQSTGIFNLQISNVSIYDQGKYLCECPVEFYIYHFKIKGQPRFLVKDKNNTLLGTEGNNLTLLCVLEGGSSPEELIVTYNGYTVASGGPDHLNYTFIPSRVDHLTDYICIANSSQFDNPLVDRVTLYIWHFPDPPTNFSSKTCPSISVSWIPGASGNLPQVFYIEYKKVKTKLWERIGPINQTTTYEMTYQIAELSFDTFYDIRIIAENEIGRSIYLPVVRTLAFVIKSTTEEKLASIHVIPLQYWLLLGTVSGSLIFISILCHVCHHRVIQIPVDAPNNRQLETLYEEIESVQYHFISVAPVVPAPPQDNVEINSNRYGIESENNSRESYGNADPEITLADNGSGQSSSERHSGQVVNLRNDNLEPEFDNHLSEEQTINARHYENLYTPLRQDTREDHHYSQCRPSGVIQERNTQTIVNTSDYINLML